MLYHQFQDLRLPALGFGTMRLPLLPDGSKEIDQAELDRMVDAAMAAGVNYFDTAAPYHGGKSEIAIGKSLARYPPGELVSGGQVPRTSERPRRQAAGARGRV